jgi:hypothetical protein
MQYRVIPFTAKASQSDSTDVVARQVQAIIDAQAAEGWEYCQMESVETAVRPSGGCFGFGAQPGYVTSAQILVFQRQS